jgi:murein DD-endopeptidase MepM/ murein hydrolase activator NlpD
LPPPRAARLRARSGGAAVGRVPGALVLRRRRAAARLPQPVAPPAAPLPPQAGGTFPIDGASSFGGRDARFGAARNGHVHQGQDVIAASGTPIVAPLPGAILFSGDQPAGAGLFLVLHGADARDYVFMHLLAGSVAVVVGEGVRRGQRLARVGATGDATGPHLHFEIWVGGWGTAKGHPIDPLPQLERWAAGR